MNKKILALLLAMSLMLTLASCGSKKEETPETDEPIAEEETAPEEETASGEESEEAEESVPEEMPEAEEEIVTEPEEEKPVEEEKPAEEQKPVEEQKPAEEEKPAETPETETPAAGGMDLNAFYLSLVETYGENFPANMNLCEVQEMLEGFYPGLSAIDTKQMMIYQPMMGAVVCEIALVEVSNSADVDAVKAIFQSRIDAQVDGGAWYPESIEGWQNNSRIVANGNCVMMIAYSECEAIVSAFNALFA